jgi:hypothetical protein
METQCVFSETGTVFFNVYKNFVLQRLNSLWLSVDFSPAASRRRLTLTSSRQNVGQTADLFLTILELTGLRSQNELYAMYSRNFFRALSYLLTPWSRVRLEKLTSKLYS